MILDLVWDVDVNTDFSLVFLERVSWNTLILLFEVNLLEVLSGTYFAIPCGGVLFNGAM